VKAKSKPNQLLAALQQSERASILRHGQRIAELVQPSDSRQRRFGTLKGLLSMTREQVLEATRPMTASRRTLKPFG
jgi:hypothetical protein